MITDHLYDAGWPRDDSKGCIAAVAASGGMYEGTEECGASLMEHQGSEYVDDNTCSGPPECDEYHVCERHAAARRNPGDMHEPRPWLYLDKLDWSDHVHPYVD